MSSNKNISLFKVFIFVLERCPSYQVKRYSWRLTCWTKHAMSSTWTRMRWSLYTRRESVGPPWWASPELSLLDMLCVINYSNQCECVSLLCWPKFLSLLMLCGIVNLGSGNGLLRHGTKSLSKISVYLVPINNYSLTVRSCDVCVYRWQWLEWWQQPFTDSHRRETSHY